MFSRGIIIALGSLSFVGAKLSVDKNRVEQMRIKKKLAATQGTSESNDQ